MKGRVSNLLKEIFKEAENGVIEIDDWKFYVRFYTRINGKSNMVSDSEYPLFEIRDFQSLVDVTTRYLTVAEEFYKENKDYYDLYDDKFYKRLLVDLFASASRGDLNDINRYISKKTDMLLDTQIKEGTFKVGDYEGLDIYCKINKNRSYYEAPYNMDIYFKNNDEIFYLPSLNFSLIKDTCYLSSVQRKKDIETNTLSKKLDRYLRKVNKGVDSEDDISKISPNALVALTIFNSYLRNKGIKEIKTDTYLPIRYYGYKDKLSHKKNIDIEQEKIRLDLDQFNMTNKFMYLLLRYDYHFDTGYEYDDLKDEMTLHLDDIKKKDDNIIYNIDECVNEYNKKRRQVNGRVN